MDRTTPTPEQLRQALRNTAQRPRNCAPAVRQACRQAPTPAYLEALERLLRGAQ